MFRFCWNTMEEVCDKCVHFTKWKSLIGIHLLIDQILHCTFIWDVQKPHVPESVFFSPTLFISIYHVILLHMWYYISLTQGTCYLLDALIQSDLHTQYCGQSPQEQFGVKCLAQGHNDMLTGVWTCDHLIPIPRLYPPRHTPPYQM